MSRKKSISVDWPKDVKAACERLIHPSVEDAGERDRQFRLLAVLLAGPVLVALATVQLGIQNFSGATTLFFAAMAFGIGLLAPFTLMATGRRGIIEPASLALSAAGTGTLIAAAGGLASPYAMMAFALALEAGWVARTRHAIGWGFLAAGAAVLFSIAIKGLVISAGEPSAWHWALPLAYAATLAVRMRLELPEREPVRDEPEPGLEDIINATILRLHPSGEVLQASAKSEGMLGVAPEMLLGNGFFERIQVADRVAWLSALANLREGNGAQTLRLRIRVPAGSGRSAGSAYRTFTGELVARAGVEGCVLVLREDALTEELEEALLQARAEAEGAVRARDDLLASVSHELRTPLNAIVGFSDVLANEMFGPLANERQREYVRLIHQAGGHLLSVVNAVLDISKLQSSYQPQADIFRFEEAVRLCMAMTARQAQEKSVDLRAEIAEDVGRISCDRRILQQVLINLLSNAVKFSPAGEVKVTARRDGDRLDFTVSDTGIGISADDLKRLGKPFMQLENDYTEEGTGLGLALVKGLVRLQGGGMSIESTPGAGTRVHVSLPVGGLERQGQNEERAAAIIGANWNGDWDNEAERKTA